MAESAALRPDGHAAIIANVFLRAGGHVEERCLAAVGVADQRYVYRVAFPPRTAGAGPGLRRRLYAAFPPRLPPGGHGIVEGHHGSLTV